MRLFLIRHAQTASNIKGLLDSRIPGPGLTELGYQQAAAIPAALEGRGVSSIRVSNMSRTGQTATPLARARGLTAVVDPGLREIEAGEMEMASGMEPLTRYMDVAWAWAKGDLSVRMPGAQDGFEFFERFDTAVDLALERGGSDPVIISHGASIRVWISHRCRNVSESFAAENELHNTGAALVKRHDSGDWELLEWKAFPLGGVELHGKSGPEEEDPTGSLTDHEVQQRGLTARTDR